MTSASIVRSLDELNDLINKRERLLAKRIGMAPSAKRDRLVRKMQNRLVRNYQHRDELTGQPQPFDEFNIRLNVEERDGKKFGTIYVDIFDSPLDPVFVGGDPLIMQTSFQDGKGTDDANGSWSGRDSKSTTALANGDYWDGNNKQTLSESSQQLAYTLENFDTGKVTLYLDPAKGSFNDRVENMTQIYSQDFYELC